MNDLLEAMRSNDRERICDAIITAGKESRRELRPEIEAHLMNADAQIRAEAIKTLGFYWAIPEHHETARAMLEFDVEEDVREMAALALSAYVDRRAEDLELLLRIVTSDTESEWLRDAVYDTAVVRAGLPRRQLAINTRRVPGFEQKADWKLLARLVETCGELLPPRLRELAALGDGSA
ncbi:MAG: HEAT repeat domain-containing protein [bacterium]